MTNVLLVDDHELIRQGLARAFERDGSMSVVGQAAASPRHLQLGRHRSRTSLSRTSSCRTAPASTSCERFGPRARDVGLVMLTMHTGDTQIFAAMEAGASAFLNKASRGDEVVRAAAHAVKAPRSFLCTGLAGAVMRRASTAAAHLTPREREILELLADGLNAGEIAHKLYLGESTVKTHISHLYEKLGAGNRAQALVTAMRRGLLMNSYSAAV